MGPSSPSASEKVFEALAACKQNSHQPVTLPILFKWISEHYPGSSMPSIRRAIDMGITEGIILESDLTSNAFFLVQKSKKAVSVDAETVDVGRKKEEKKEQPFSPKKTAQDQACKIKPFPFPNVP